MLAAMHRQIDRLAYAHTSFSPAMPSSSLPEHPPAMAPGELNYAYFVSGGSEAVETALKMARQYFVEIVCDRGTRFIARKQSYHGNTLGALAVGKRMAPAVSLLPFINGCYPRLRLQ